MSELEVMLRDVQKVSTCFISFLRRLYRLQGKAIKDDKMMAFIITCGYKKEMRKLLTN